MKSIRSVKSIRESLGKQAINFDDFMFSNNEQELLEDNYNKRHDKTSKKQERKSVLRKDKFDKTKRIRNKFKKSRFSKSKFKSK